MAKARRRSWVTQTLSASVWVPAVRFVVLDVWLDDDTGAPGWSAYPVAGFLCRLRRNWFCLAEDRYRLPATASARTAEGWAADPEVADQVPLLPGLVAERLAEWPDDPEVGPRGEWQILACDWPPEDDSARFTVAAGPAVELLRSRALNDREAAAKAAGAAKAEGGPTP